MNHSVQYERRLIIALVKYTLNRNFRVSEIDVGEETDYLLRVRFNNNIVWICFAEDDVANRVRMSEDGEIVLIRYSLINTDISRSTYEITFVRPDGEQIFRSIETVSPLRIMSEK